MFANPQRTTRSRSGLNALKDQDENKFPTKKDAPGKPVAPTAAVTRRRAALGDVSNYASQPTNEAAGKGIKTRATLRQKPAVTQAKKTAPIQAPAVTTRARSAVAPSLPDPTVPETHEETKQSFSPQKEDNDSDLEIPVTADIQEEPEVTLKSAIPIPVSKEVVNEDQTHLAKKSKVVQDWVDLDADDADDPMMVSEYVVEIYEYMRKLELTTMPDPDYMDHQKDLAWKMRGILADWLIEVHQKFRLLPETLFLTMNIVDRFLSLRVVSLVKLQLVGVTAMFLAAKYEEVIAPSVHNFVYMADNSYTADEILKAERYLLKVLNFNLSYPNPMNFLRRISKADDYDIQSRTLGKYLMEISLMEHSLLSYPPSMQAAASLYLARLMLDRGEWNPTLCHYAGYTANEIEPCAQKMLDYLQAPTKHESFFKKYASKKFLKASLFVKEWIAQKTESMNGDA